MNHPEKRYAYDEGEVIVYKGYEIRPVIEPWALKYGYAFEFNNDEHIHHAKTLQDCYEMIDELTNE